ncbi:MAG: SDR family NAD(P)-dependent oxidoreductase, partial [Ignavibacterium sp.]
MQNNLFENKTILIAGASGGIGNSLSMKLLKSSANIIAVYNKNHPDDLIAKNITLFKADLTKPEEWDKLLQFTHDIYGRIDVMINCTGVLIPGDFLNHTEEQIIEMINTNFSSALIGTHKTLKIIKEQRFGQIINLGSVGGIISMPYTSVYCATKFALRGFTYSVAQELKDTGVSISLISPGPVNTNMLKLEANHKKTAVAFVSNVINPEQVAESIIKTMSHPKTEVIIPSHLSLSAKSLFFFPRIFSTF